MKEKSISGKAKNLVKLIGIDGAIFFTLIAKVVQASGGLISVIFISRYLNLIEQGYYYTFGSILSIQIFFELGLSGVITQFVAHEVALLKWEGPICLNGSPEALSRLSSLLSFCVKWFSFLAVILFTILIITGLFFFNKFGGKENNVDWITPWIIISFSTSCSFIFSPILAFLEGLGKVKNVAIFRLVQQSIQISVLFICLMLHLKIYSSPLAYLIAFLITPIYIYGSINFLILKQIWLQIQSWTINYKEEIFPYQWRIALSWISGYFMYQLFNPVTFATDGAIVAGQMGITIVLLNGILSISLSWLNTKIPLFSNLIARKNYFDLDKIFKKTITQTSFVSLLGVCSFILFIYVLKINHNPISNRFLPILPLTLLAISTFANQFVSALAIYLRCHKKEPFLIFSIVLAILTTGSTLVLGKYFGVLGITFGFCFLSVFVSLIWAIIIFKNKKQMWHQIEFIN